MQRAWIRQAVMAMEGYVPGEQPSDKGVIKLNTNENPYPPSPLVEQALRTAPLDDLRRYPDPVCRAIRERLAEIHGCTPDHVFVGNGSDEVLALCTRAFVEPAGAIGYFEPSYSLYPVLTDIQAVAKRPVELDAGFGWQMPADYTASLFFLTNPNAPTSMLFPPDTVAAFCRRFPGVVVIDEAYVDFARASCLELALTLPNVLVGRTFSKSFSLAGLRVGYLVGTPALIAALYKLKDSYNVDALAQRLTLAALNDLDYMRANATRIVATRERLAAALAALGFAVCPSDTNFLWTRPTRLPAQALFERLRADRIYIRYFPGPRTGDYVRITVGTDGQVDTLLAWLRKELA